MLKLNDFSFQYKSQNKEDTHFALQHINLQIAEGDFVGITGNSGAGKSTLTYALNGIIPHHYQGDFYGAVAVDGMDTVETPLEKISLRVGNVFQDIDGQMVASVVEDEMLFGLENFGVPRNEIESRLQGALDMVGIGDLRERSISTLSGGQKQKLAIAAVIALKPKILVLDEPTGELDPQSSRQIFFMLQKLNEELGITIVVVEQKIMLLCEFAKRLVVLDRGEILLQGTVKEVLQESGKMEAIGVHCPRVVSLAKELQSKGLYQGPPPLDVPQAAAMVREILA